MTDRNCVMLPYWHKFNNSWWQRTCPTACHGLGFLVEAYLLYCLKFCSRWRLAARVTFRPLHPWETFRLSTWLEEWLDPTAGLDLTCERKIHPRLWNRTPNLGSSSPLPRHYTDGDTRLWSSCKGKDLIGVFEFILSWFKLRGLWSRYGHDEGMQFRLVNGYWRIGEACCYCFFFGSV